MDLKEQVWTRLAAILLCLGFGAHWLHLIPSGGWIDFGAPETWSLIAAGLIAGGTVLGGLALAVDAVGQKVRWRESYGLFCAVIGAAYLALWATESWSGGWSLLVQATVYAAAVALLADSFFAAFLGMSIGHVALFYAIPAWIAWAPWPPLTWILPTVAVLGALGVLSSFLPESKENLTGAAKAA